MPTIAIGSPGSTAADARGAGDASCPPVSSPSRTSATADGVGWSKTRVAGSRRPVAAPTPLRSSMAARESKPSSRKVRRASSPSGVGWPSAVAAWVRTRSTSSRIWSARGSARSRAANAPCAPAPSTAPAARRTGARTRPRNSGGRVPTAACARSAPRSSGSGTATGASSASAASNRAAPCSSEIGSTPAPAIRRRVCSSTSAVMSLRWFQKPQAREVAGCPWVRRWWARASR
ncbi:hypothetical protein Save01_09095 [Streptomyces avermitilis]